MGGDLNWGIAVSKENVLRGNKAILLLYASYLGPSNPYKVTFPF
jgi:hypothetical protein